VGDGDFGSGGDFELEHGDGASGSLRADEVADGEASEADFFLGGSWHEFSVFPVFGVRVISYRVGFRCRENGHLSDDETVVKMGQPAPISPENPRSLRA
jgi:hypothetical protein